MSAPRSPSSAAFFAFAAALLMLAAHVAAKATRDAVFLSHYDVTVLPRAMLAAAVVSLGCAALASGLLQHHGPRRVLPRALALSAVLFIAEWALLLVAPRVAAVSIYLHFAGLGAVLISGFWSVMNERFDPHRGKAVVARAGGFAALGGVVGGVAAERISAWFGVPAMLPTLALLHLGAAGAVLAIGRRAGRVDTPSVVPAPRVWGLDLVRRTPLLAQMASLVALIAVVDALLDYALKATASEHLSGGEALIQFFAVFYTLAGLLAFGLQASVGGRVLSRLGLGGAIALAPIGVALTGIGAVLAPRLLTVGVARGAAFALTNSFFRAGFELLYTPIPLEIKRPTKAWVDVGAQRLGDLLGGSAILLLLFVVPGLSASAIVAVAVTVSLLCLWIVRRLHGGYVKQLAHSLRTGVVSLREEDAVDATTTRTLAETHVAIDRAELQARIRAWQRAQGSGESPVARAAHPYPESLAPVLRALDDPKPDVVRQVLRAHGDDPRLVVHVLALLERPDVEEAALHYLRGHAQHAGDQLVDALLDRSRGVLTRRRLPQILEAQGGRRALSGLLRGLEDPDFDVRLACGRSAARLIRADRSLRLAPGDVNAPAARELSTSTRTFEQRGRRREGLVDDSVLLAGGPGTHIGRSLDHVFTVLGLAYGLELMGSALRGVHADDDNLRGTALEYLETTLPEDLYAALRQRLPGRWRGRPEDPDEEALALDRS